jgi:hypothetical protein
MTNKLPGFNAEASLHKSGSNYHQIYSGSKIEGIIPAQLRRRGGGGGGVGLGWVIYHCKGWCKNCETDLTTGTTKCGQPYCCEGTIIISW